MSSPQSQPPPLATTETMIKRYKPIWRFLLISNLALGAYIFAKARTKTLSAKNSNKAAKKDLKGAKRSLEDSLESEQATGTLIEDQPSSPPILPKEPIPEDQQRELFKWVLEEKRKVKPKDPEEKKRINEEKAILKQFIRSKSIPSL